jgi:Zn-dependent protease with chaperone function
LTGTWYDGRGSRRRTARVSQPKAGWLRVEPEDGEALEVAVDSISISPRLGNTPRTIDLKSGGQVECADAPEFDTWFPRQSRIETAADWLERRKTTAIGAAVTTLVAVVLFFVFGLPWIAGFIADRIPPVAEHAIGAQTMALLERTGAIKPSKLPAARQQALQAGFHALVAGLPRVEDMHLELRDGPGIGPNAFALPGGAIVMTDQLVQIAGSDDELVAVLAHEAGHHVRRHALRMAIENGGVAAMAGFLFGDVSGSGTLAVSIPVLLLNNGYSRAHESEADQFAFDLLRQRGMSPRLLADMLRRLQKIHGDSKGTMSYLSTHPPTQDRIDAAERAAAAK